MITILFLDGGKLFTPSVGSVWKALLWLSAYAALIGRFNAIFKTSYFYLCEKPGSPTLLDYMGPWPWYLIAGDLFALASFGLLWLPFLTRMRQTAA